MNIPKKVIDHCAAHKLCKGCPLNCVAPAADHKFQEWLCDQIKRVLALYGIA
jgi:hypothetical protein